MKCKKILSIALSAGLMAALISGCGSEDASSPTETAGTNVTVEEAVLRDISKTVSYTGELMTSDKAAVTSKVTAKITSVKAEVGDWVDKGDVLLVLDSSDYEYALKQAQASYNQAQASYNQAQASYNQVEAGQKQADVAVSSAEVSYETVKNGTNEQTIAQLEQAVSAATIAYNDAKTNYDRQEQLYNMGAISLVTFESAKSALENARIALDTAKKNYDLGVNVLAPGNEASAQKGVETAQASRDSAKASLDSAKAAMETASAAKEAAQLAITQAKDNIANTTITAPISGYISAKNATLGQFASAGLTLFEINASDNLEAEIQVTESVISHVNVGDKAFISISSSDIKNIEGSVSVVNPVKSQTGMYLVRVSVPNSDSKLKIGMFADITLVTDESAENTLSVPSDSILQEGDEYYVYVVSGDTAEKRVIETGVTDGLYTQVLSGVKNGEQVVVDGKEYISEVNNIVNIVE